MATFQAGDPIRIDQAKKYVEEYLPLKQKLIDEVLTRLSAAERASPIFEETVTYFSSNINAFIFSKELVMNLFAPTGSTETAEYMIVMYAAKYEGDDVGNPTVVVAGVNEDGAGSYKSLPVEYPALEQPPYEVLATFPDPSFLGGRIKFTVL